MTLNTLLKSLDVMNHSSQAKFPDGSGGEDKYLMSIYMEGHGKILNAKVDEIRIHRGSIWLSVRGEQRGTQKSKGYIG